MSSRRWPRCADWARLRPFADWLGIGGINRRERENMAMKTKKADVVVQGANQWRHDHRCEEPEVPTRLPHICQYGCYWITAPVDYTMTLRLVRVTPVIAREWLKRNNNNRTFSRLQARVLAAEMLAGYWTENGESIIFDSVGELVDGQHRLQAVLNSGHEYIAPVVTGVQVVVRPTVDTGNKRSGGANLQMAGEKNAAVLSATLMLWKGYVAHDIGAMTHPQQGPPERRTSIPRIMEYLQEWPEIRESVRASLALRPSGQGRALVPASEVALVWHAIVQSGSSPERADEYLSAVLSGFNLSADNPIIGLRRRLIDQARPGLKMVKRERMAIVLKTWQLWSTGQTRKVIRWDTDEPFPFLS